MLYYRHVLFSNPFSAPMLRCTGVFGLVKHNILRGEQLSPGLVLSLRRGAVWTRHSLAQRKSGTKHDESVTYWSDIGQIRSQNRCCCCFFQVDRVIYTRGCVKKFEELIQGNLTTLGGVGVGIALLQVLYYDMRIKSIPCTRYLATEIWSAPG